MVGSDGVGFIKVYTFWGILVSKPGRSRSVKTKVLVTSRLVMHVIFAGCVEPVCFDFFMSLSYGDWISRFREVWGTDGSSDVCGGILTTPSDFFVVAEVFLSPRDKGGEFNEPYGVSAAGGVEVAGIFVEVVVLKFGLSGGGAPVWFYVGSGWICDAGASRARDVECFANRCHTDSLGIES